MRTGTDNQRCCSTGFPFCETGIGMTNLTYKGTLTQHLTYKGTLTSLKCHGDLSHSNILMHSLESYRT